MPNRSLASSGSFRRPAVFERDPFLSFRQQMDRLFDDFFAPMESQGQTLSLRAGGWPSIDMHETDQAYEVEAELPGLEQKDVEVNLRDNSLLITGEKRNEHKEETGGRHYTERSYGRFERMIPFDVEVDPDKVEARFKNGVLSVKVPKNPKASSKTRHVEVKAQ
ncbi:Hsp20/alpha crystallin family protein [Mesorhizobium sp. BAC0120]|uniref:Hsp20/alpha crystallin family protein n=1 Tax=Mesorhizobium sp. BAC0120 TaxID=3090670 RepID=UPI00298C3540|nr:Hsp20/alpha crystallin family protein [Mesorhizobium sp. BAC0120]MDW6021545.1 Hsp20/alpha crystallin family protein [Mesorhizobium sp. BAC0120]